MKTMEQRLALMLERLLNGWDSADTNLNESDINNSDLWEEARSLIAERETKIKGESGGE